MNKTYQNPVCAGADPFVLLAEGMYYHYSPVSLSKYPCNNGDVRSFELVFDTDEKGELDAGSTIYRYIRY